MTAIPGIDHDMSAKAFNDGFMKQNELTNTVIATVAH